MPILGVVKSLEGMMTSLGVKSPCNVGYDRKKLKIHFGTKGERKCHDQMATKLPRRPDGDLNGFGNQMETKMACRPDW